METNDVATPENAEISQLSDLKRKMSLTGSVKKTTLAGAVIDVGINSWCHTYITITKRTCESG
jgi:transcriptional accessory protein Tex/SPT6